MKSKDEILQERANKNSYHDWMSFCYDCPLLIEDETKEIMQEYADQQIADKEKERLYWQQLAEAAIAYIDESPCDPDIYPKQFEAWNKFQQLKDQKPKEE